MFKKIISCAGLTLLVCVVSGCAKVTSTIEIDNRNNVSVSQVAAINVAAVKNLFPDAEYKESKSFIKGKEELEEHGYIVQDYEDEDGFQGVQMYKDTNVKEFKTTDLPEGFEVGQETDMPITMIKTPFKTKYEINLVFNPNNIEGVPKRPASIVKKTKKKVKKKSDQTDGNSETAVPDEILQENQTDAQQGDNSQDTEGANAISDGDDASDANSENSQTDAVWTAIDSIMQNPNTRPEFTLTIKIPKKATENNATTVASSREYVWELSAQKPVEIVLKYEKWNILSIIFLFVIVFATLAFVSNNKKYIIKDEDEETKNAF